MSIVIPILIICILILINGLFVAAEFAIVSVPRTRLHQLSSQGSKPAKRLLEVINSPILQNRYFTTAQTGISIVSLGLGMYGEHTLASWIRTLLHPLGSLAEPTAHSIALILSVSLLTYFHVVLGEMIPKSLSIHSAEFVALNVITPMSVIERMLFPLVYILNEGGMLFTHLLRIPKPSIEETQISADELEYIVKESSHSGKIESRDQILIENILDLEDRTAAHIMTPRNLIEGISLTSDTAEIINTICKSSKTRFLVYRDDFDDVAGILHIKDLARSLARTPDIKTLRISELVRETIFIPETLPLDDLLHQLQAGNHQIAVVFDEFGGISGLITLEDLIEEVVGEIRDEFDIETSPIEKISPTLLRVRGDVILEELQQLYHLDLEYENINTIGGLVMALLGRIPKVNDRVEIDGLTIEVESVSGRAVQNALIHISENKSKNPI